MSELVNNENNANSAKAFLFYYKGFIVIQPIINLFLDYSTYIVFAFLLLCCVVWALLNFKSEADAIKPLLLIILVFCHFAIDFIFRFNSMTLSYLEKFIMYGALPIIFLSTVTDFKKLAQLNSYYSLVVFLLFCASPFVGIEKFGISDYMSFGFGVALPCYVGMYVGRSLFRQKPMIIFELFCLFELVVYANRSCILCVLALWLLRFLFFTKKTKTTYILFASILAVLILCLINVKDIILFINDKIILPFNIENRTWRYLVGFAKGSSLNMFFSHRLDIWNNAIHLINENFWFGIGIGKFESIYGSGLYSHNLFLELMLTGGLFFTIIVSILFIYYSYRSFKNGDIGVRAVLLIFFSISIVSLMLSNIYFKENTLWALICLISIRGAQRRKNENINCKQIFLSSSSDSI